MTTNPSANNLKNLLDTTKSTVKHHKEMTKIKGEHFNLFSVLNVETMENKTHSAFLAELLDPKGCHLQGSIFLELFLQVVSRDLEEDNEKITLLEKFINKGKSKVIKEFGIGKRDDLEKAGGRVDIYIEKGKNTLCIENKIYAQDQYTQIERYCNHNKENNTVIYLTLYGQDASAESKGSLKSGIDYYNLSYRDHIIEWLELCLKEVPNLTSVRESINQYILLIKKLTKTLNMEQEKELRDTMSKYLEEASFIASNYEDMVSKFRERFRKDVKMFLESKIDLEKYSLDYGLSVTKEYSQIWININNLNNNEIKFGVESFSGRGHGNGDMFVGLFDKNTSEVLKDIPSENQKNIMSRQTRPLQTKVGNDINLSDIYTLKILANPLSEDYRNLVNVVVEQILDFVKSYKEKLPPEIFEDIQLNLLKVSIKKERIFAELKSKYKIRRRINPEKLASFYTLGCISRFLLFFKGHM